MSETKSRLADAELHYIRFENVESFSKLVRRHGLSYHGEADGKAHRYWWARHGDLELSLLTAKDPRKNEGYASYVAVGGELPEVESLYRDVIETAHGIKGEFRPLTAEDGEVIAENWRGRDNM